MSITKCAAAVIGLLLAVQSALIEPALAQSNVYYVDAVNGSDENDGVSEATAWRSAQRAAEAALVSGDSVLFHAGQTFYNASIAPTCGNLTFGAYGQGDMPTLCGGVLGGKWQIDGGLYTMKVFLEKEPYLLKVGDKLYRRQLTEDYSATAAGRFSYDSDNGVLYLNEHDLSANAETLIQQTEHIFYIDKCKKINISGLKMIMTGGAAVNINSGESQYITVDGNEIAYAESYYSDGSGINCSSVRYSMFSNNIIHDVYGDGIMLWNCAGCTVSGNKIYNIRMGNNIGGDGIQCAGKEGNAAPNNRIVDNYVSMQGTNVGKGCIQQENGDNVYIAGNVCLYGNFGIEANSNNGIVENNICAYQGVESGVNWSAGLYISEEEDVDGMIWRGNMVCESRSFGFRIGGPKDNVRTGFKIYNNTIFSKGAAFSALVGFDAEIYNNIFCSLGTQGTVYNISSVIEGGSVASDCNIIYPERSGCISYLGKAYNSLDAFRIASGREQNSKACEPLIYGKEMSFSAAPPRSEFEPYANSPAVGAGCAIEGSEIYRAGCNIGAIQTTVRPNRFEVIGVTYSGAEDAQVTAELTVINTPDSEKTFEIYTSAAKDGRLEEVRLYKAAVGAGSLERITLPMEFTADTEGCNISLFVWSNMTPLFVKTGYRAEAAQ